MPESDFLAGYPDRHAAPDSRFPPLEPAVFLNRELSWLDFNTRVLTLGQDSSTPLLERAKFLAIFSSNLDEYFMIRVAGVKRKVTAGIHDSGPDGRTPSETYAAIRATTSALLDEQATILRRSILPDLKRHGISIATVSDLTATQVAALNTRFENEIFPVLTPQGIDRSRRFPHVSNDSLNLLVLLSSASAGLRFARVKVPAVLPRLVRVPARRAKSGGDDDRALFVWLEDLIASRLERMFPGNDVLAAYPFHVVRDSDIEVDEQDDDHADLIETMRELLSERTFGSVVKLMVDASMPGDVRDWLMAQLATTEQETYIVNAPLALESLWELHALDRQDLKDAPYAPVSLHAGDDAIEPPLDETAWGVPDIFAELRRRDVLVHHPYQSFNAFTEFLKAASTDPAVVAIKQTLYRIGKNSPLVPALVEARDDDTQVAVLLEVKARFDEENNISWARELEHHGVHVAYGLAGLKTHCKLTLVVRREADGLRRYAHLATGNYNASTARIYEDLGLFTSNEEICHDVSELFNVLTGYAAQDDYRVLWVAPGKLRGQVLQAISDEIARHQREGNGRITFKMNSLVDKAVIRALYGASRAGVEIDLIIRGTCCLVPGVPGWSETIRVRSIVGRFLEHSRIYAFGGEDGPLLLGSADMMERNLDRRVEVIFPVLDPGLRSRIRDEILPAYLADTVNAWELDGRGRWHRLKGATGAERDVQAGFMASYASPPAKAPAEAGGVLE